ncbi:MAG: HD domain-containing protein [Anaerolineae bacterium]
MDYELLDRALIFAARAHKGQFRKGTDIPYLAHPVALALTLTELHCSDDVIAAALLHDVVEDTDVSLAEIERAFGPAIAAIVAAVSEPDRDAPWETRKQHTINKLRRAPLPVKLVACADKLHNIRAIARDHAALGDALWKRFGRGKQKQAWYYRGLAQSLPHGLQQPEKYPIFARFVQEVDNFFGPA